MAKPITVSIGDVNLTISNGDLPSDGFAQFVSGELKLASDVIGAVLNKPISDLSTDILQASLAAQKDLSWTLGSISLQLSPSAQGTVTIRKSGEVFRFTESEQDDDPKLRQIITVPAGKAYVSIELDVNIGVSAAGGFSNGSFGVKGSAQLSDRFLLANHCLVDQTGTVRGALQVAFESFLLPFSDSAYRDIKPGNFLEYEFYGRLNMSVDASLGFSGVLFGGASGGELRRSFSSPIGSVVASATPSFQLGADFNVAYAHEDAFRFVLNGLPDKSRLFLFKMNQSTLSAGLQLNAGVTVNASVSLAVQVDTLIQKAAERLFGGISDPALRNKLIQEFVQKVKDSKGELDKYVQEAQDAVNNLLKKLDKLTVSAGIAFQRISEHAVLLSIDFDRNASPNGYKLAVQGDMVKAFAQPGTSLAPGSYIRSELDKTTSLSFQLFGTFNATSVQTYFEKSELLYVGNGVFQLRFSTGVTAESNVFGHEKAIDLYFEITADTTAAGVITDKDILLHITTTEKNNAEAARRTAGMLHLILKGSSGEGLDDALRQALLHNPKLNVSVAIVFEANAYRRLPFTAFVGGKPTNEQTADALNYQAFVNAVDLIYAGSGFGTQGFPDMVDEFKNWAHYNITAIDKESAIRPPNRRELGNSNTDSVWPQDPTNFPAVNADKSIRPMLLTFLIAAQEFMNVCEDLPMLAKDLDQATTQTTFGNVLHEADALVKEGAGGFPLFFTKPLVAALVNQSNGTVTEVQSLGPGVAAADTFSIQITVA